MKNTMTGDDELTDDELLSGIMQLTLTSSTFDFLNGEEDLYTKDDVKKDIDG